MGRPVAAARRRLRIRVQGAVQGVYGSVSLGYRVF